jgi:CubicO group peptidase (beta-lactamase class C family)
MPKVSRTAIRREPPESGRVEIHRHGPSVAGGCRSQEQKGKLPVIADSGEPSHVLPSGPRQKLALWYTLLAGLVLAVSILVGCTSSTQEEDLKAIEYRPATGGDWRISTPAEHGLAPLRVAELYHNAAQLETLYGLLVVKDGSLIAEKYFHEGSIDQSSGRQSATKSVTSALVGIALRQGCLSSLHQRMIDFFPKLADQVTDPRKKQITVQQLLQMRAGYPWEEREPPYFEILFMRGNWHWLPHLLDVPLTSDPGTEFKYSNLSSHLLGVIVAQACNTDLKSLAEELLFSPMNARVTQWTTDADGYNWGQFEIHLTARDMAKFGLLYLNNGEYQGQQLLPAEWVRDSLRRYSQDIDFTGWMSSRLGHYFRDVGYGYQWWSASAGGHPFDFAWGHGGQLIILLHQFDMVIVTTADPLFELPGEQGWKHEGAIIDLVGRFIESLPNEDSLSSGS